jgi:hypothetical protein
MNADHFIWLLLAVSNAPIETTAQARIKADWLKQAANQVDQAAQKIDKSEDKPRSDDHKQ